MSKPDARHLARSLSLLLEEERKAGRLRSEGVRCFVKMVQPVEWIEDATAVDGGHFRPVWEEEPYPVLLVQAYSYRWDAEGNPSGTYAGQLELSPQLLEHAPMDVVLPVIVDDLQRGHDSVRS